MQCCGTEQAGPHLRDRTVMGGITAIDLQGAGGTEGELQTELFLLTLTTGKGLPRAAAGLFGGESDHELVSTVAVGPAVCSGAPGSTGPQKPAGHRSAPRSTTTAPGALLALI